MPKSKLTSAFVRRCDCSAGVRKVDFFDAALPGFMLEVRSSGGKTFYQRYRDAHGRERQFKIGPAHVLTVGQARRKAREVLAQAALGSDPQQEREKLRRIPTLADFVRDSYLPYAKNVKQSWKTDETILRIHVLRKTGGLTLDQITNQDVADLIRRMQDAGYASGTTNRVLIILRHIFNLAIRWGSVGELRNPTTGLKTAPDVLRERVLALDETRRLLSALDEDENQTAASAIKLLLLTGARRNEVTYAKWEYVNWEQQTLLVPRSKTGQPRSIRLNSPALQLLRSIPRLENNPFIFPSPVNGRPSPSLHFPWRRIRQRAGLQDVRLHDLRHSFASFLVNQGVSLYVVQGLLGHLHARTTQRYAHLASKTLRDAAEIVGEAILAKPDGEQSISEQRPFDAMDSTRFPARSI